MHSLYNSILAGIKAALESQDVSVGQVVAKKTLIGIGKA
jgi:hypothetical protein